MPLMPISPEKLARRRANDRIRRVRSRLTRFATEDARFTPAQLRHPYRMDQWQALTQEERYEHLRQGMFDTEYPRCLEDAVLNPPPRVRAYLALSPEDQAAVNDKTYVPPADPEPTLPEAPASAELTRTPTASEVSNEQAAAPRARYWLPCRTCGEYVPVESPRDKRAKCPEHTN